MFKKQKYIVIGSSSPYTSDMIWCKQKQDFVFDSIGTSSEAVGDKNYLLEGSEASVAYYKGCGKKLQPVVYPIQSRLSYQEIMHL